FQVRQELAHAIALLDGSQQRGVQLQRVLPLQVLGHQVLSIEQRRQMRLQPGLEGITRSTIRRRLHEEGFHFYEGQTWCESHDPEFESKKPNRKPLSQSAGRRRRGLR